MRSTSLGGPTFDHASILEHTFEGSSFRFDLALGQAQLRSHSTMIPAAPDHVVGKTEPERRNG